MLWSLRRHVWTGFVRWETLLFRDVLGTADEFVRLIVPFQTASSNHFWALTSRHVFLCNNSTVTGVSMKQVVEMEILERCEVLHNGLWIVMASKGKSRLCRKAFFFPETNEPSLPV